MSYKNNKILLNGSEIASNVETINFTNVTITDDGNNKVTITSTFTNIFGTEFQYIEDEIISTTTSTNWIQKIRLSTVSIPSGNYRIGWNYQWNHNKTKDDFEGRVQINDITTIMNHKQEPKDSSGSNGTTGANQAHQLSGFKMISLAAGIHTIDIDYRTQDNEHESSIWSARLELWRVS